MKILNRLNYGALTCVLLLVPLFTVCASAKTISFEDVPQHNYLNIPAGYGGLRWYNFMAYSPAPANSTWITSGTNVAININQESPAISGSTFNLYGASITARFAASCQIRVVGKSGANTIYDNSYTIISNGPTFINFNYNGVDRVDFLCNGNGIAVDDVVIDILELAPVKSLRIETPTITHYFQQPFPEPELYSMGMDFLVGQGSAQLPAVNANFDTNQQFTVSITAPSGMDFHIEPKDGLNVFFSGNLTWDMGFDYGGDPDWLNGPCTVNFNGSGGKPIISTNAAVLSVGHGTFGFQIEPTPIRRSLTFHSITISGTFTSIYNQSGTLHYVPNDSALGLSYTVNSATDPGPVISLVPISRGKPSR